MIDLRTAGVMAVALTLQSLIGGRQALADSTPAANMPLTYAEQAKRLAGLASRSVARGLYPPSPAAIRPAPYFQRDYRAEWIRMSTYERTRIAERIGNQGRARFAAEQGWVKIVGSQNRGIAQGPDSVVWDRRSGKLRVLEAKGGSSAIKQTYGSWQGTNANAIRSSEFVLKSEGASEFERLAAARVIKAAQVNCLQTGVVKTGHVLGRAGMPRLDGGWSSTNVAQEAFDIERRLTQQRPHLASTFKTAKVLHWADRLVYRTTQGTAIAGLAGAGLLGWDTYQQSRIAWAMWTDPATQNTALPCLHAGLAAGRGLEAASLGLGSVAQLGWLSKGTLNTLGRAAGRRFLPIAVGVEGLNAGITYYEYSTGRISRRDFYRRTTGPAIFGVFTTGGAIIGGVAGVQAGGVSAVPGAVAGAKVGAAAAVPVQFVADWAWGWYYEKFDTKQRAAVNAAVDRQYGMANSR